MKKNILFFIFLSIVGIIYLLPKTISKNGFVTINDKKFVLDGKPYFPLTINYFVSARLDGDNYWACPCFDYNTDKRYTYTSKDSSLKELKADMDLIREMGFNSVRLVGMCEPQVDEKTGAITFSAKDSTHEKSFLLSTDASYEQYFGVLSELLDVVGKAGLKAILLTKVRPDIKSSEDHLRRLATRFKADTNIMAYDLFNEPLYFEESGRTKKEIFDCVNKWEKILEMYAPHQLSTIGLEGIREVFKWDPNILNVDFISFHPYEYEPEQVRNEIYWYGKHVTKPWIIGETAISADGDSIDYDIQKEFAVKTIKQAYNCGASGYSWWQYKDVNWHVFHADFMGLLNHKGESHTQKENIAIQGTRKPVAEVFKNFDPAAKKDSCICLDNYYDYSQLRTSRITGRLVDGNNKPVDGGVVLGWNINWRHSYHAISKPDGSFSLTADFPFYHWMASATKFEMVRGDANPDSAITAEDNVPTMNLGDIRIRHLSFIK